MTVQDVQALQSFPNLEEPTPVDDASQPISWRRVLWYPIPAYQVAAGVLLLLFSSLIFWDQWKKQPPSIEGPYEVVVKGVPIDQDQYPEALVFEL